MSGGAGEAPTAGSVRAGLAIAQANIAVVSSDGDEQAARDFALSIPRVTDGATSADGFLWQLPEADRAQGLPPAGGRARFVVNLSVWRSFDAMRAFTFRDPSHLASMRARDEWADRLDFHGVLWWIAADERPTLLELDARLGYLERQGPTPLAFTVRTPQPPPDDLGLPPA